MNKEKTEESSKNVQEKLSEVYVKLFAHHYTQCNRGDLRNFLEQSCYLSRCIPVEACWNNAFDKGMVSRENINEWSEKRRNYLAKIEKELSRN